ncbi:MULTISPECIES: hypothetical protein [unclassified Microcoleus]|uniref:hypothetical protein n=1 Tax=unclassified Microcoleus TaxID=2642155 RepID=UPI002FD5EAB6
MFVAQSIRQPDQFYYAHTLSSARRWKTRRGADKAVAQYPNSYIVIAEAEIGSLLHKSQFLIARIQVEKAAEQAYRNHSSEAFSPEYPDTHFEELAVQAWERYQQQRLQEVTS